MNTLKVNVEFFGGKRRTLPYSGYRPHFIADGDTEMLGIEFTELGPTEFDESCGATVKTLYDGVDYSKLKVGASFSVVEGATVGGKGCVTE